MSFLAAAAPALIGGAGGLIAANNMPKNTYQASAPDIQKQDLVGQLNTLTPEQQQLTNMLMQQAQGQGANPAQQMLNQATNKNIQQTAGQIASTRGLSPALAARLAAQSGASQAQTAAGQGAVMGAEQQIAAQGLLNQHLGQQEATLQQAQAAQNSAINQGGLGAQGINSGIAGQNAAASQKAIGGALSGFASALGGGAGGGAAEADWQGANVGYADGGDVVQENLWDSVKKAFSTPPPAAQAGESREQKYARIREQNGERMSGKRPSEVNPDTYAKGGKVKAMVSPGEVYIPPEKILAARNGNPLEVGEKIPGKAPVKGNSPKNDVVQKDLEAGGQVIKRTAATSKDKAKAFMEELARKKEDDGPKGFNRVLEVKQHLDKAHAALMKAHKAIAKAK